MLYVCVGECWMLCFCLYCDAWSCRCSCMGSMSVSSCICCMFMSCVNPVAVLNAAFCSLLISTSLLSSYIRCAYCQDFPF